MKSVEINNDELKLEEIDETVTRVKTFLINSKNEILIATSNGGCQLPGGHREDGEILSDTVKREVQEETGIMLETSEIVEPFFEIVHMTKNYHGTGKNRRSNVIYYLIKTDKKIDLNNTNLTEHEKEYKFSVEYVDKDNFENFVNNFINSTQSEINVIIANEMLTAFSELKNIIG